jgi:hypothetical protein
VAAAAGFRLRVPDDGGCGFARDFYSVTDRDIAVVGSNRSGDSFAAQFFPQVHMQTSYPMASQYENYQVTLEPIVALTMAPNVDVNTKDSE